MYGYLIASLFVCLFARVVCSSACMLVCLRLLVCLYVNVCVRLYGSWFVRSNICVVGCLTVCLRVCLILLLCARLFDWLYVCLRV